MILHSGSPWWISKKKKFIQVVRWLEFQDNKECTHQQVGPRLKEVVGVEDSFVVSTQV